jgi:hypothetical protein
MSEDKKRYAIWSISLDVECPHCFAYIDLLDIADFWDGRPFDPLEHRTRRTEDVQVDCTECDKPFTVDFEF